MVTATLTFTSDVDLKGTVTKTHTSDVSLKAVTTIKHTTDAKIGNPNVLTLDQNWAFFVLRNYPYPKYDEDYRAAKTDMQNLSVLIDTLPVFPK